MTTTGGSIGVSLGGKPKITNVGFNQDSRDKQGITRNTVVGDVEITEAEGSPINRDITRANEVTKDTHSRTNINVEPQVIEYISNPAKFKEDLEVAILEGKATGETVLKSIENAVNGGKEDIGDPERRAINEIKEAVIRVKTAPQMESIAEAKDLNSPDVLEKLGIAAIEKYDPYDPNLPIKVRRRVEKTLEDGKIPGVFYDKTTNKIFVYKGMEDDLEIRAGIAREWKISEDLKDGKGKPNEEGRLKETVAGELAYDDMMKQEREGKTGTISTDRFADAVMDEDSEVTSDSSDVYVDLYIEKIIEETKEILAPLKSSNLNMEQKRNILAQYDKKLTQNQVRAKINKIKLESPYEGIYILGSDMPEYLIGIIKNDNLYLHDFDPVAWNRVKNREEYKKMQNKLIQNGEILLKEYLKNHPYLEKSNQIKNVSQEVKNPKSKNERTRDSRLQTSEKFVGIEELDIKRRQEKNKEIPDLVNSMEFALGTSSMIGTLIFHKVKNNDGSIDLTVKLKYNLTDDFAKVYGKYGPEYGKPYHMIGKTEYHTYKKIKSHFKNETEYLNYIKDLK